MILHCGCCGRRPAEVNTRKEPSGPSTHTLKWVLEIRSISTEKGEKNITNDLFKSSSFECLKCSICEVNFRRQILKVIQSKNFQHLTYSTRNFILHFVNALVCCVISVVITRNSIYKEVPRNYITPLFRKGNIRKEDNYNYNYYYSYYHRMNTFGGSVGVMSVFPIVAPVRCCGWSDERAEKLSLYIDACGSDAVAADTPMLTLEHFNASNVSVIMILHLFPGELVARFGKNLSSWSEISFRLCCEWKMRCVFFWMKNPIISQYSWSMNLLNLHWKLFVQIATSIKK